MREYASKNADRSPAAEVEGRKGKAVAPGNVVQRKILYKGTQYNRAELFDKTNAKIFDEILALGKIAGYNMGGVSKMANDGKVYDAENNFVEADVALEKTPQERRIEASLPHAKEVTLEKRTRDYPDVKTLFAPIDKAIIVINDGHYQFVGTSGLINCVEVMIEYHTETDKGYLVAHVNGGIEDDEAEIRRQLTLMLETLGQHLRKEINWAEFEEDSPTKKITLVRSAKLKEQNMIVNMRNILAESGAHMQLVNSNSASMEITADGARYYDNMPDKPNVSPPETDFRKTEGYPFKE
ncbi:hypothetical protein [Dinghuibacter silviterrae]|uniref:Uncharacterized protein n=1 Tax=Dinghuibacter silviterrae TaxID=1539049 RepID=A0A4R8DQC5_9BACT|nr:hypothetical protein [Dinghuibacter silviterrae]TDX00342.1 hypothetical protein EDB95_1363 [Dinghuibacter silviterrae]